MRRIAQEAEIEIAVKVVLSVVIGMSLSETLGWRNSMTITFTMILVTYQNRGFAGCRTYYRLRMQTQVLLCLLMYMMVVPLQRFTPLEDWIILLITITPVAAFFLFLYFGWGYTPMNLTPIISPLMLMNTALSNTEFYYWRIIFTFIALLLGWGITLVYPFRSKVPRTQRSLERISDAMLNELENITTGGAFVLSDSYQKKLPDILYELAEIDRYLNVVYQDIHTFKYRAFQKHIPRIKALRASNQALLSLTQYIGANTKALHAFDDTFRAYSMEALAHARSLGRAALDGTNGCAAEMPPEELSLPADLMSPAQISFLALVVKYNQQTALLVASGHPC